MRIKPFPPTDPDLPSPEIKARQVYWVQIYLLNHRQRKNLSAKSDDVQKVYKQAISGRNGGYGLPKKILDRAAEMISEFPPIVRGYFGYESKCPPTLEDFSDLARSIEIFRQPNKNSFMEFEIGEDFDLETRQNLDLLILALNNLSSMPISVDDRSHLVSCRYCWLPPRYNSRFCVEHAPGTALYQRRHSSELQEASRHSDLVAEVRKKRKALAGEMGFLVKKEMGLNGRIKYNDIDNDFLEGLDYYWPTLAEYINYSSQEDYGGAVFNYIMVKVGFGPTPKIAMDTMERLYPGGRWQALDVVEAYLKLWKETSSYQSQKGQPNMMTHVLSAEQEARVRHLASQGVSQQMIISEMGVSRTTIYRILNQYL